MSTRTVLVDKKDTASVARCSFWAIASEAITIGDVVCYDLSQTDNDDYKYVLRSDTDSINSAVPAGVALATVVSGAAVEVVYWGQASIRCDGTTDISVGDRLVISATAGVAITQTLDITSAATLKASLKPQEIGMALAGYTTNSVDLVSVFVRLPRPD
jgi:hypothetical protein